MTSDLGNLIFKEDVPLLDSITKSEIKKSILLKVCSEHTHVFVLALNPSQNKLTSIVYKEKSSPIAGYTYDAKFGQYYVECANYLDLGTIPISFSIRIDKISRWECKIPLTEPIIKKYLDAKQVEQLWKFKDTNKGCKFEFMQLVSCY
jgi:hypothetical protein